MANITNENCSLRTSLSPDSFCLSCQDSIINTRDNQCSNYCDVAQKNPFTNFCVACFLDNCAEFPKSVFTTTQLEPFVFYSRGNREILTPQLQSLVEISVSNFPRSDFLFDNQKLDEGVKTYLHYDQRLVGQELTTIFDNSIYDLNRNLIQQNLRNTLPVNTSETCEKQAAAEILGWSVLVLLGLMLLIILSVYFMRLDVFTKFELCKFFISVLVFSQLTGFYLFVGIQLPCCLKKFLNAVFKFAIE